MSLRNGINGSPGIWLCSGYPPGALFDMDSGFAELIHFCLIWPQSTICQGDSRFVPRVEVGATVSNRCTQLFEM